MPDPEQVARAIERPDARDHWTPVGRMALATVVGQQLCTVRDFGSYVALVFESGEAFRIDLASDDAGHTEEDAVSRWFSPESITG